MRHRIILVCEWGAQVTGSGCCGRLGGANDELGDGEAFRKNRTEMEAMGMVYRALHEALVDEDVELTIVDPRNMVWLVPALVRDAWRRGLSLRETWKSIRGGVSYNSVVLDGKVLFRGQVPSPDEAVSAVRDELEGVRSVGG